MALTSPRLPRREPHRLDCRDGSSKHLILHARLQGRRHAIPNARLRAAPTRAEMASGRGRSGDHPRRDGGLAALPTGLAARRRPDCACAVSARSHPPRATPTGNRDKSTARGSGRGATSEPVMVGRWTRDSRAQRQPEQAPRLWRRRGARHLSLPHLRRRSTPGQPLWRLRDRHSAGWRANRPARPLQNT
jgi:hypothetical protein